jgi:hypothetical protein
MKRLLPLCLVMAITACNQPYDSSDDPAPETISVPQKDAENKWQYDIPMGGETYSYAHSAILKANNSKAHLKLFNDPPINMVILQLDGDKFNNDTARTMGITVQFDERSEKPISVR